ncbi:hypothetical protein ABZP36_015918 [Zizania latifolia]
MRDPAAQLSSPPHTASSWPARTKSPDSSVSRTPLARRRPWQPPPTRRHPGLLTLTPTPRVPAAVAAAPTAMADFRRPYRSDLRPPPPSAPDHPSFPYSNGYFRSSSPNENGYYFSFLGSATGG